MYGTEIARVARAKSRAERERKANFALGFVAGCVFMSLFTITCFILRDIAVFL